MHFNKKEIGVYIIVVLFLGFIFGFDDGQKVFDMNYWVINLFRSILLRGPDRKGNFTASWNYINSCFSNN